MGGETPVFLISGEKSNGRAEQKKELERRREEKLRWRGPKTGRRRTCASIGLGERVKRVGNK